MSWHERSALLVPASGGEEDKNGRNSMIRLSSTPQVNEGLWKQADDDKEKLFTLMEQVRAKLDKKSTTRQVNINLRGCQWGEVMDEVQTIGRREKDCTKISKTMMCIERVGRASGAFESWLQLLPTGDYGSSICGVFKLVIGAAGQYAKVEEIIFEALADIPEMMENAREYLRIYDDQRHKRLENLTIEFFRLEKLTFELFRAILRTLTQIMRFFADSSVRRLLEPLLNQSAYKSELIKSKVEVHKIVEKIKDEANICQARRLLEQGLLISATHITTEQVRDNTEQIMLLLRGIYNSLSRVTDSNSHRPAIKSRDSEISSSDRRNQKKAVEAAKKLLDLIRYDPDIALRDVDTCRQLGRRLDSMAKSRAAAVIRNSRFKFRMGQETSSGSLLVNGREDLGAVEGSSPLSLVAAELAAISADTESVFSVSYFADQHRPYMDPSNLSSPVGLMASLIGQLVSQMVDRGVAIDLSFLTDADWHRVEKMKLAILHIIFRELTKQIPSRSILICTLDEISLYENSMLGGDTDATLRRLTRLVRNSEDITFKLLVTCRGHALGISKYFENDIVDLDENIEIDDSSAWQVASMAQVL
ncbi:hypothetical protein BX600DRAFT_474796 [Xylariales sp. PMI_506]|nr:hypothetical protein BX600DRAFT_474796 [Xylariales sp. PMI_506]